MTENNESLLIFPCDFAIKVFGASSDEFETTVLGIILKHAPNLAEDSIRSRLSKDGKYLALTITVKAESQVQLDDIYRALSSNPLVLMAL